MLQISRILNAILLASCAAIAVASHASAASAPDVASRGDDITTVAAIAGPTDIAIGRTLILDASSSQTTGEKVEYRWSIDETKQTVGRGVELIYTPSKTGTITFRLSVKSVGLDGRPQQSEALHQVTAFKRKIVVIAGDVIDTEKLLGHAKRALETGVYLRVVQPVTGNGLLSTDALTTLLSEKKDMFVGAEAIVIWGDEISGLQSLLMVARNDPDKRAQIQNTALVLLSGGSLAQLGRSMHGIFGALNPKQILATRAEALNPLIDADSMTLVTTVLEQRDIDFQSVAAGDFAVRPWNVLSQIVNMLIANGVSNQTVLLLLMLPVIATVFTFLKQVVGITTFGLYTPCIITLSFLSLGWWMGLAYFFFILASGYFTRSSIARWRMLYIPKAAIVLTIVSFALLLMVALGASYGFTFSRDTALMLLILSTIGEYFLNLKAEEGLSSAAFAIGETLFGAFLCIVLVQWQWLQLLLLAYPEYILLTLAINIFLAKWTGLRLVEYFRFYEVFRHVQQEE